MKSSKLSIETKSRVQPILRFEEQSLTSFSGLVIFQSLFERLDLKSRLRRCFKHVPDNPTFSQSRIVLLLIVHILLGYRELRHIQAYKDDQLVKRIVGLTKLPDVSTISRRLASMDTASVEAIQTLSTNIVTHRLSELGISRVTLDFDGSVIGTSRYCEGAAVGFNRKKKGQRSYYPLLCTVAQTSQVLDVLHRSGNVHDSNGAREFILACIEKIRTALPGTKVEVRMDSAFFSDEIIVELERQGVEYTVSVPFERFLTLKQSIEERKWWHTVDPSSDYFEQRWKPKSWKNRHRFLFVRQESKIQHKGAVQLDIFIPYEYGYDFKVIISNKMLKAKQLIAYHNGRGSQEGLFAELKSQNQFAYIPTRGWNGNKIYMHCTLMAHNLTKEMQMRATPPMRTITAKRPALWAFKQLGTIRRELIQKAGRLISPQGKLTLSMSINKENQSQLLRYMDALSPTS
jgi:hypothetical protein